MSKQEPVAWIGVDKDGDRSIAFEQKILHEDGYPFTSPLYIAPPKREWVGLTDEQIYEHEWWDEETAFAVNKELKEKNT